jgi:hypothetical protein
MEMVDNASGYPDNSLSVLRDSVAFETGTRANNQHK